MKKTISLLTIVLSVLSCADDGGIGAIDNGWSLFEGGDYQGAYDAFASATETLPAEAYTGLGWAALQISRDSVNAANGYFAEATSLNSLATDAYAGWSMVAWARNEHSACIARAQIVLNQDADWRLFDTNVDVDDVKYHKAFGHFRLGQYSDCVTLMQQLDASWTAPSLSDPNIDELLLAKLEELFSELI